MTDLNSVVETIAHRLTAQRGAFYHSGVWVALLRLLAQGEPVSIRQLSEAVRQSPSEVEQILSYCPDLELDGQNSIVGMGLSLNPTPHRFQINGHPLYTWCALDTFGDQALNLNLFESIVSRCYLTYCKTYGLLRQISACY